MDTDIAISVGENVESGESFDTTYEVHLPNGVVIDDADLEDALHTIQHFRRKYKEGKMKVFKVETHRKEGLVLVDG